MEKTGMWHWFAAEYDQMVVLGLYRDILGTAVVVIMTPLAAWHPLRAHKRRQDKIIDLLDTTTPTGLGEVAVLLNRDNRSPESFMDDTD